MQPAWLRGGRWGCTPSSLRGSAPGSDHGPSTRFHRKEVTVLPPGRKRTSRYPSSLRGCPRASSNRPRHSSALLLIGGLTTLFGMTLKLRNAPRAMVLAGSFGSRNSSVGTMRMPPPAPMSVPYVAMATPRGTSRTYVQNAGRSTMPFTRAAVRASRHREGL